MMRTIRLTLFLAIPFSQLPDASAQQTAAEWLVSTGRQKNADGQWTATGYTAANQWDIPKAVAHELAQAEITRDWSSAGAKLERWTAICTWSGLPDREKLLEHLALRKVELYERFGRTSEALAAVEGVLVPADWKPTDGLELKPATADDLALQARVLATEFVATNRERLRGLAAAPPVADNEILHIVLNATHAHDRTQIAQLGKRAVPALREIAASEANRWKAEAEDPLSFLMEFDEAAAAALILEEFDRGGSFWRRRAMRSMRTHQVLRNKGTWVKDADDPPRLVETWWLPVVLRLLREPDVATESLDLAADLAMGDALDDALTAAVLELLRSGEREAVAGVEAMLHAAGGRAGTQRILVAMLASRDAEQRAFAARELVDYRDVPELRAAIASPDRALRVAAVQTLGLRQVYRSRVSLEGGLPSQTHRERFDPSAPTADEIALLETGLRDADAGVRAEAAGILSARGFAIADATWDALAVDTDAHVRAIVARAASHAPPATAARALAVLAKDVDPAVLTAVDTALHEACQPPNVDPFLPAIRARRANTRLPFRAKPSDASRLYQQMITTTDGATLVGEWAEAGDPEAQTYAVEFVRVRIAAAKRGDALPYVPAAIGIPYDDRRLARIYAAVSSSPQMGQPVADIIGDLRVTDRAPWRELALDGGQPLWLRLRAFGLAFDPRDEALVAALARVLIEAPESAKSKLELDLRFAFERLDETAARRVLAAVLAAHPAPALTGTIATVYVREHELDSAAADVILAANLSDPAVWWSWDGALAALRQVAARPLAEQGDWLVRAAKRRVFSLNAVQLLGELREPAYRQVLVECIDAGWMPDDGSERANVRLAAIVAIGRYLDDEAVEILLDAATRFSGNNLGKACYEALERIQVHREQRAAWEQRKRAGATKDAAIGELVKILESGDAPQRAQAVRSLATLGAVEELPRVVKLLKDSDATVRAAAASALEVLNSSTAKPR